MRIEDRFTVVAPKDVVWRAIRDPSVVATCVPGCEKVTTLTPTLYKGVVRVQLGPIKASFKIDVEIVSETEFEEVRTRTRGEEGGKASALSSENVLRLIAIDRDTTEVQYSAEVSVVGRLGKFGLGVMKKKAESLGREFAASFKERLERQQ
jgi:uncharacterized protein